MSLSLLPFVAARGGVHDRAYAGELHQLGLARWRVPFVGAVCRPTGKPLDTMREVAAEAGYLLPWSTVGEFLELLESEAKGWKVYPVGDGTSLELTAARQAQEERAEIRAAKQLLREALPWASFSAAERLRIAEAAARGRLDPIDAADEFVEQQMLADEGLRLRRHRYPLLWARHLVLMRASMRRKRADPGYRARENARRQARRRR